MKYLELAACLLSTAVLGTAAPPVSGQTPDFCAVRLFVTDTQTNQPVLTAIARLVDSSGRVVKAEDITKGRADFCDFGFGKYTILIRSTASDCLATEIKNVHVVYGFTQDLKADLNSCADEGDGGGNACFTYVRLTSPDGLPINGASIKNSQSFDVDRTDSYGRAQVAVQSGTQEEFTFLHRGYKPGHLHLSCASHSWGWSEAAIVLQPEEPARTAR